MSLFTHNNCEREFPCWKREIESNIKKIYYQGKKKHSGSEMMLETRDPEEIQVESDYWINGESSFYQRFEISIRKKTNLTTEIYKHNSGNPIILGTHVPHLAQCRSRIELKWVGEGT